MADREFRDIQRSLTRSPRKPKDENRAKNNQSDYKPHSFAVQWNYEESKETVTSSAATTKKQILPSDRENLLSHPIYREISMVNGRINRYGHTRMPHL